MPSFLVIGIHDVITCIKFGDDRLRGLGVVMGFAIDFAGRPYSINKSALRQHIMNNDNVLALT